MYFIIDENDSDILTIDQDSLGVEVHGDPTLNPRDNKFSIFNVRPVPGEPDCYSNTNAWNSEILRAKNKSSKTVAEPLSRPEDQYQWHILPR